MCKQNYRVTLFNGKKNDRTVSCWYRREQAKTGKRRCAAKRKNWLSLCFLVQVFVIQKTMKKTNMKGAFVVASLGNATNLSSRLKRHHKVQYNKALHTAGPLGCIRGRCGKYTSHIYTSNTDSSSRSFLIKRIICVCVRKERGTQTKLSHEAIMFDCLQTKTLMCTMWQMPICISSYIYILLTWTLSFFFILKHEWANYGPWARCSPLFIRPTELQETALIINKSLGE